MYTLREWLARCMRLPYTTLAPQNDRIMPCHRAEVTPLNHKPLAPPNNNHPHMANRIGIQEQQYPDTVRAFVECSFCPEPLSVWIVALVLPNSKCPKRQAPHNNCTALTLSLLPRMLDLDSCRQVGVMK